SFNKPFGEIVGISIKDTLLRSINTSLTTGLALVALYYFGGDVTKNFALVLLAGVIAGAYSSIFFASPLLVWYAEWKEKGTVKSS
ncbi:protein translocase subunit SecF, partial [Candidatus Nomurabacteria bacterium]|nr:protein translocase subunit SecF [Candidatus Nomurabacteria bacterium]